ncbi:exported hypothetical protein [Candidatus Desulfarcum epimagneticum]|uniref:Uncharacterized protein n=1 Tax=uncultured Desulfobacteraceae bacterium TaxID=218296 RepID=A0A484HIW5_9BACT|nr:exported hypothetical protein [uncultured Desulfobacteraceae bacterium]
MKKSVWAFVIFFMCVSVAGSARGEDGARSAPKGIEASRLREIRGVGQAVLRSRRDGRDALRFREDQRVLETLRRTLRNLRRDMIEEGRGMEKTEEGASRMDTPMKFIKEMEPDSHIERSARERSEISRGKVASKIRETGLALGRLESGYGAQRTESSAIDRLLSVIGAERAKTLSETQKADAIKASKIAAFSAELSEISALSAEDRLSALDDLIKRSEKPSAHPMPLKPFRGRGNR